MFGGLVKERMKIHTKKLAEKRKRTVIAKRFNTETGQRLFSRLFQGKPSACLVISDNSGYNDAIHQFCGKTNKEQF
jgi:hypothetical protein